MNQRQKQQLTRIDRTTGYLILIILTSALIGILSYGFYLIFRTEEIRYAVVDQISSLRLSDPVKFNGVDIGRVSKITRKDQKIIIQFTVSNKFDLHEGYYMRTGDIGIMGDRTLHIFQGDTLRPLIEKSDTLKINFVSGMSHLLGQAYKLPTMVDDWKNGVHLMLRGTDERKSVVYTLKTVGKKLDSTFIYLFDVIDKINQKDYHFIDSLNKIASHTIDLSEKTSNALNKSLPKLDTSLVDLLDFIETLDNVSINLLNNVEKIKSNKLIAEDQITPLIDQLKEIRRILDDIRIDCLKLRGVVKEIRVIRKM